MLNAKRPKQKLTKLEERQEIQSNQNREEEGMRREDIAEMAKGQIPQDSVANKGQELGGMGSLQGVLSS